MVLSGRRSTEHLVDPSGFPPPMPDPAQETITIDRLDRRLVHVLMLDGRLPFRRIAEVLGASEQTVARRYRRLREAGILRVVAMRDPRRYRENLFVRIATAPGSAGPIGEALARRDDVSWVAVAAGGTEVICAVRSDDPRDRDSLILESLPRVGRVTGVTSAELLHVFAGGALEEWHALEDPLLPHELAALADEIRAGALRPEGLDAGADVDVLTPDDDELLRLLAVDGRATYAALAAATGRNEAAVARRVDALFARGTLFVDVELAFSLLGFRTTAMLWLTVAPRDLDRVGAELAIHPEVAFVGAVSGPTNLVVSVTVRDTAALYRFLTDRLGAHDEIRQVEVAIAARRLKQAGTVMDGDRLPSPLAG